MNRNSGQFPDSAIHDKQSVKITRPESEVTFSKEKAVLHHEGQHVEVPGPSKVSGKGKASDVAKVLGAIKQSYGRND